MTRITHCHYTLGLYLGTTDQTVLHAVFVNGSPVTPERADGRLTAEYARALYHGAKGARQLVERNGDSNVETVLEEAI